MSWYRMHRGWWEHKVFGREAYCRRAAFDWLIGNAAFEPRPYWHKGLTIDVARGQLVASERHLAEVWKWDRQRVRTFLRHLEDDGFLTRELTHGISIVTICKYEIYQAGGDDLKPIIQPGTNPALTHDKPNIKEGKELKKREKEARERASLPKDYAFEGQVIRLIVADYDKWLAAYHAVPDLRAELMSLDAWLTEQPDEKRKKWFIIVSQSLNRKHQEIMQWRRANDVPSEPAKSFTTAEYYRQMDAQGGIRRSEYN